MQATINATVTQTTTTYPTPLGNVIVEQTDVNLVAVITEEEEPEEDYGGDEKEELYSAFIFVPSEDPIAQIALIELCLNNFCNYEIVDSNGQRDVVKVFAPSFDSVAGVLAIFNIPDWNIQLL